MRYGLAGAFLVLMALMVGMRADSPRGWLHYSDGARVGKVISFERSGLIWRTYEGVLDMGGTTVTPYGDEIRNLWEFSIAETDADNLLIDTLMEAQVMDRTVRLHYQQDAITLPWRSSTGRHVYHVDYATPYYEEVTP